MSRSDSELATVTDFPGEWSLIGWCPPPNLPFEQWHDIGQALGALHKSLRWIIGDWLNYGEANYGEKYSQAVYDDLFSYQDLRNIASVAARVPLSQRCDKLTWTHHRNVAHLPHGEQAEWLALAAENGWTTRQLENAVNGRHTSPTPEPEPPPEPTAPAPIRTRAEYRAAIAELETGAPKPERKAALAATVETWAAATDAALERDDAVADLVTCPECGASFGIGG